MTNCPRCKSYDVIKKGFNHVENRKVQKFRCHSCKHMFSYDDRLPRHHVSSEIMSRCMDLYFQGLSYRVISQHLRENYDLKVSHGTVYFWIQRYAEYIKEYTDTLQPKLSAVWQLDETWISFKGVEENLKIRKSEGNWCWICIDTKTRFILDMYLAIDVQVRSGERFFQRLRKLGYSQPEVIVTDGNKAYKTCINKYYPRTTHLNIKKISLKPNTSFIERFNGTVKNRTKTMRCFEEFYSCQNTLTAFQIYYNFLRPHDALGGKTPAQEAGINLDLPNRWATLIRKSLVLGTS